MKDANMKLKDWEKLVEDISEELAKNLNSTFGIIGRTTVTFRLIELFYAIGEEKRLLGVYSDLEGSRGDGRFRKVEDLLNDTPDIVILASDSEKEQLLDQIVPFLRTETRIILAGYAHLAFRDPAFDDIVRTALVPSLANGYPHTLVHLYQCLQNAARLGLDGVVAEFGMFKGGTTMMLSRFVEVLGQSWPVIGFDTFAGFPPKRSVLDMYDHPDCVFSDEDLVRRFVLGRSIEVVSGDVLDSAARLAQEEVILAFVDTDNYSSASAVIDIIQDRIVVGGAIVFDHFTGRDRFRYTLGERLAAKRLLSDNRYFNLHDTGVFIRQR